MKYEIALTKENITLDELKANDKAARKMRQIERNLQTIKEIKNQTGVYSKGVYNLETKKMNPKFETIIAELQLDNKELDDELIDIVEDIALGKEETTKAAEAEAKAKEEAEAKAKTEEEAKKKAEEEAKKPQKNNIQRFMGI